MTLYPLSENKRKKLRELAIKGAANYAHYLIGKEFLIICEDGSADVVRFYKADFKHLTGIRTSLSDDDFFNQCLNRKLDLGNIHEYQKHNWQTLKSKNERIQHIHRLLFDGIDGALFVINLHTPTKDYPVAIKNTNIDACVGFVEDNKARTLRKYNSSNDFDKQKRIIAIYSKKPSDLKYCNMIYITTLREVYEKKPDIDEYLCNNLKEQREYIF